MNLDKIFSSHIKREGLAAIVYFIQLIIMFLLIFSNKKFNSLFVVILIIAFFCFPLRQVYKVFSLIQFKSNCENKLLNNKKFSVFFNGKDYTLMDEYIIDYKNMKLLFYKDINKIKKRNGINNILTKHPESIEIIEIYTNSNLEKYALISRIYNKPNISKQYYYENLYEYLKSKNSNL